MMEAVCVIRNRRSVGESEWKVISEGYFTPRRSDGDMRPRTYAQCERWVENKLRGATRSPRLLHWQVWNTKEKKAEDEWGGFGTGGFGEGGFGE